MYIYNDDGRSLEFRDADDLKTFLLEEYAPALLAKALAKDAFDRACTMGFDEADDFIEMWTSEYLSQNSWTVNHGADERRVDVEAREIQAIEGWPMSRALKEAAIRVWEE